MLKERGEARAAQDGSFKKEEELKNISNECRKEKAKI